jgi:hypothetical protein
MRKALTMLGAFAAFALGSLLLATPASATIDCFKINTNPTQTAWPKGDWGMKCVNSATPTFPTQTNGDNMLNAIPGVGQDELRRAPNRNFESTTTPFRGGLNGVRYYLFHTAADYDTWAASNGGVVTHTAKDFGVTKIDARGIPVYSAIWEENGQGEATNIKRAVGTQMGVSLNYLWGYIKNGGIVPSVRFRFSDTIASPANAWQNIFKQNLDRDWALFTGAPCKVGSSFGLFSKYADNRLPVSSSTYICTDDAGTTGFGDGTALSPTYANLPACVGVPPSGSAACNKAIVIQAWPELYGDIHALFAQEYAFMNVANDQATSGRTRDVYLNGRFTCSKMMLRMAGQGKLPTAGDLTTAESTAACIVPAMTTKCLKLFSGGHTGQFPDGNIFNCTGTQANTVPLHTQQALDQLGGTGYSNAKDKLDRERADVYSFLNIQAYKDAFAPTGEAYTATATDNDCGLTAPIGASNVRIWRSIINQACAGANSDGKHKYTTVHELGHVIDITKGQPSGTAAFDLAFQADLFVLNYDGYPNYREACGAAPNPGPLNGLKDRNGKYYCSGSSGNGGTKNNDWLTFNSIWDILKFDMAHELGYQSTPDPIGSPPVTVNPGWYELYPQGLLSGQNWATLTDL